MSIWRTTHWLQGTDEDGSYVVHQATSSISDRVRLAVIARNEMDNAEALITPHEAREIAQFLLQAADDVEAMP